MTGSGMSTLSTRRRRDGGVGQRVWDSQKNVERSSKVLVWSCASGGGVTRYTPCAWPAGWGLSCPPRVAIRRTTLWCCSFSSRFSSRFPAPPKEVKVHTGTDYHSMVSECRIWPSGGQESKKNLRQHSVLDWSPTSILSGPCDACLRGSDETRKVHRGMAADKK
jgi:hypothetical protein